MNIQPPRKKNFSSPFMSLYGIRHKIVQFRNTFFKEARRGEKSMMLPHVLDNFLRAFFLSPPPNVIIFFFGVYFIDFMGGGSWKWYKIKKSLEIEKMEGVLNKFNVS